MRQRATILAVAALALVLGGCLPGASVVAPPSFRLLAEGTGLVRLEAPGVGGGAAVFELNLEVANTNAFGISLAELEGDLFLDNQRVADALFVGGLVIPAQGTNALKLQVRVPYAGAGALVTELAGLIAGEPTRYRLEAAVAVAVFGTVQRFPTPIAVEGTLSQPLAFAVPTISFDRAQSGIRELGLQGATVDVAFEIDNRTLFGYRLEAPIVRLLLGGRQVGQASLVGQSLPAFTKTPVTIRFQASTADLGVSLFGLLQAGGSGVAVGLSGSLEFGIPGLISESVGLDDVVQGRF